MTFSGLLASAVMLACCGWAAFVVARRLAPEAPRHARVAGAALGFLWLQVAAFALLAQAGLFRIDVASVGWIAVALAADRTLGGAAARETLLADLAAARDTLGEFAASPIRLALLTMGGLVTASRLVRDLVSPPLAWDAFLYHLVRPARWVQSGRLAADRGPDAWGYLEHFPFAGDVPWAWAMLADRSDALVAPAGVLVVGICALAGYALARSAGAERTPAGLAALAIAYLPPVANTSTSTYADNFVLAAFLLAGVFTVRVAGAPRAGAGEATLAGAGFGLMASAKSSGLPVLTLALAFLAWVLLRGCSTGRREARLGLLGLAAGAAIVLPGWLHTWASAGSPFYPLKVPFGEALGLAHNETLRMLYAGELHDLAGHDASLTSLLDALLVPVSGARHEHVGFGYGALPLALLGAAGALRLRAGPVRLAFAVLGAAALLPLVGIMSDAFLAHRTIWQQIIGRLLTPLPALLAVLGAQSREGRPKQALFALAIGSGLALSVPQGWSEPALVGVARTAPALGAALLLLALAAAIGRFAGRPFLASALGALGACAIAAPTLACARSDLRHAFFAALNAPERPAYQIHPLEPTYASAATIWEALDDGEPRRIALAAGWDGIGHNLYRYPLLGAHLQNRVLYVPPTKDGAIVDTRLAGQTEHTLDRRAWLRRLAERGVDVVVVLHPRPAEQDFIEGTPRLFEPIAQSNDGLNVAYRFDRERAASEVLPRDADPEETAAAP